MTAGKPFSLPAGAAFGPGRGEREHGARHIGQRRVIAAVLGAARHLHIYVVIDRAPLRAISSR